MFRSVSPLGILSLSSSQLSSLPLEQLRWLPGSQFPSSRADVVMMFVRLSVGQSQNWIGFAARLGRQSASGVQVCILLGGS